MNLLQQYLSDFGKPSGNLRQEILHHANNVFALIGERSTLSDAIKQSIDRECDQILKIDYSGLDGVLTRLFGIHHATINRLQQLEQDIIILPKIFESLNNLSIVIQPIEDNKQLGETSNYPYHLHRSELAAGKLLHGDDSKQKYSDRISNYIQDIQSELTDLIYDLDSAIKIQSPIYQTIDEVVASIEQNPQQRENLILKFSPKKGGSNHTSTMINPAWRNTVI